MFVYFCTTIYPILRIHVPTSVYDFIDATSLTIVHIYRHRKVSLKCTCSFEKKISVTILSTNLISPFATNASKNDYQLDFQPRYDRDVKSTVPCCKNLNDP